MARKRTEPAAAAETAAPKGHNKPELTEDEKRVLIYQHKAAYTTAKKAVDDAKAELLRVCNLAKTECGKDAVADIKELILLEQPKGGDALKVDIDRKLRLARWANASVGTQFKFDDFDGAPAEDVARELGKTAGLKGEICRPPYDPSVPQHKAWIDGWHEGQAVLASNFREKLKPMEGAPAADGEQMDLSERKDLDGDDSLVMADLPAPDVSAPPFAIPDAPDLPDVRELAHNKARSEAQA